MLGDDRGPGSARRIDWDLDPGSLLERLDSLHGRAARQAADCGVELYARASVRVRLRLEGRETVFEAGRDEGLAVRVVEQKGRRLGFAAASGIDPASLEWALAEARRHAMPFGGGPEPWLAGGGPLHDHDPDPGPPEPERLERWLRGSTASSGGSDVRSAWIECGRTIESLAAHGGLRASRARNRVWAMDLLRGPGGGAERPKVFAGRRFEDLPMEPWGEDGVVPAVAGGTPKVPARVAALLDPGPASILVRALVGALCLGDPETSDAVGPGLRVREEPRHQAGLLGGSFDDAGFETASAVLCDGERTHPTRAGPGRLWRDSYRDPPTSALSTLVVEEGAADLPPRLLRVTHLRVHTLGDGRWTLEVDGLFTEDRGSGSPAPTRHLVARPGDLARRCQAAIGRSRLQPNNVLAPALLVDGL